MYKKGTTGIANTDKNYADLDDFWFFLDIWMQVFVALMLHLKLAGAQKQSSLREENELHVQRG